MQQYLWIRGKTVATVDKKFADNIKEHNGFFNGDDEDAPDNPRCVLIIEYDNAFGSVSYGAVFAGERNKYTESPHVQNPRIYWQYKEVIEG